MKRCVVRRRDGPEQHGVAASCLRELRDKGEGRPRRDPLGTAGDPLGDPLGPSRTRWDRLGKPLDPLWDPLGLSGGLAVGPAVGPSETDWGTLCGTL